MATEWDAKKYHQVSGPQQSWGLRVLERAGLEGTERVLDAGCGSGRLTQVLCERVPRGQVIGLDRSKAMLAQASLHLRGQGLKVPLVCADLQRLALRPWAELIFSTATFHWVRDHDALFAGL